MKNALNLSNVVMPWGLFWVRLLSAGVCLGLLLCVGCSSTAVMHDAITKSARFRAVSDKFGKGARNFGDYDFPEFSAKREMTYQSSNPPLSHTMISSVTHGDGNWRTEMDFGTSRGSSVTEQGTEYMRKTGKDVVVTIQRPLSQLSVCYYPKQQAGWKTSSDNFGNPYSQFNATYAKLYDDSYKTSFATCRLESNEVGEEVIDGHSCLKTRKVASDQCGVIYQSVVWQAKDLNGFPIQTQTEDARGITTIRYTDIHLNKPDPSIFEVPANIMIFENAQAYVQAVTANQSNKPDYAGAISDGVVLGTWYYNKFTNPALRNNSSIQPPRLH